MRRAVPLYAHASGRDFREVESAARALLERGFRYVRCQVAIPGFATYGATVAPGTDAADGGAPAGRGWGAYHLDPHQAPWEPTAHCRIVPRLFDHLRSALGDGVELPHDIHDRVPPTQAVGQAQELERFGPFFQEDPFAPEDSGYFPLLRQQTAIPIAMGEPYVNPAEYVPLIVGRLIDFIRVHLSAIGGLTPGRKLAALCEAFGVRTAWHGPGDVSPVGHAANLHLDLATPNFGIQESHAFGERTRDVFPGCPEIRDGMMWGNDRPGPRVDIDEAKAAKYLYPEHPLNGGWPPVRRLDGTVVRP